MYNGVVFEYTSGGDLLDYTANLGWSHRGYGKADSVNIIWSLALTENWIEEFVSQGETKDPWSILWDRQ